MLEQDQIFFWPLGEKLHHPTGFDSNFAVDHALTASPGAQAPPASGQIHRPASMPSGTSDALSGTLLQANAQRPGVTRGKFMSAAELDEVQAMKAQCKEAVATTKTLRGGQGACRGGSLLQSLLILVAK